MVPIPFSLFWKKISMHPKISCSFPLELVKLLNKSPFLEVFFCPMSNEFNFFIWSLFIRSFGFIYLFSFISILVQVKVMHKIIPIEPWLNAAKQHMGYKRFYRFPTLCWINSSDNSLKIQCIIGIISSIFIVVSFISFWLFLVDSFLALLSYSSSKNEIHHPWQGISIPP